MNVDCDSDEESDRNFYLTVDREALDEEGIVTGTSFSQFNTEELVEQCFYAHAQIVPVSLWEPHLSRQNHIHFLNGCLSGFSEKCEILDCSRAWLCYWITHSLYLLDMEPSDHTKNNIVQFLARCQSDKGGFGGGPMQDPHLAPTYAAISCVATLGTPEAYNMVNRNTMRKFLYNMRVGDGSFRMHAGGEVDVRAVYCAVVSAKLLNIFEEELFAGSADWIVQCQTYEGGFAGCPGMEAHGGYSFCAIAALHLLDAQKKCDMRALLRWAVNRQMRFEGGFQGRTNKLVDACYSFWQGATVILSTIMTSLSSGVAQVDVEAACLFNSNALQEYILICCQAPEGGLRDKPKMPRDCYHSCYALGGLSLAQNLTLNKTNVLGNPENALPPINPIFNVGIKKITSIIKYFKEETSEEVRTTEEVSQCEEGLRDMKLCD